MATQSAKAAIADAKEEAAIEEAQEDEEPEETDDALYSRKFNVLVNGVRDLQLYLEEFKKACESHEKRRRRHGKRRYYHLGLMARVVTDTTDDELRRLLKNGARTFLFDAVTNKEKDLQQIIERTKLAIDEFQREDSASRIITGLALEIHGDCCRVGRLRNNCSVLLHRGQITTLTVDQAYRYSSFREIAYVINLKYYLKSLKLKDEIFIGREVRGKVVKKLKQNVAVLIEDPGIVNSYDCIELPNQCYSLKQEEFLSLLQNDLQIANDVKADYVVMSKIRCKPFLRVLRSIINTNYSFKLIGAFDLDFISSKMLDLMGMIKLLDYLWIPDMYRVGPGLKNFVEQDVIPIAKCQKKPIIGTVPIERCSDFKRFENDDFLWKIDSIFIEKSPWCNKYPLIVKKLLPIRDFRLAIVENCMAMKNILTSYQSVVNFIIRTISSIECQAIYLFSRCEPAVIALGRVEIYCPVYILIPITDDEDEEYECKINLARSLNLRRNLRSVIYTRDMNECNYKPIDYGIDYTRRNGCIDTGDFVITLEVGKEDEENVGMDKDIVMLRAFYVPPPKTCEKFKYG